MRREAAGQSEIVPSSDATKSYPNSGSCMALSDVTSSIGDVPREPVPSTTNGPMLHVARKPPSAVSLVRYMTRNKGQGSGRT